MENRNLYLLEFGEGVSQQSSFMSISGPAVRPTYVVAKDYNEAARKASFYLETKLEEIEAAKSKEVLTDDGSLRFGPPRDPGEIKILGLKHISEVIW